MAGEIATVELEVCTICGQPSKLYICPKCDREQKVARMKMRFERSCPPLYQETLKDRLPQASLSQVMSWQYAQRGLILSGPTGQGKTRCAWLLIQRLMTEDLIPVVCFDCVQFGHELVRRFRNDDDDVTGWLDSLAQAQLLFFDDFGKDRFTERVEQELFAVIERRCANKLPIILTTNDKGDSLNERMTENRGPALIRRLREFCYVVTF